MPGEPPWECWRQGLPGVAKIHGENEDLTSPRNSGWFQSLVGGGWWLVVSNIGLVWGNDGK
jgi:hypothetical protein